MGAEERMFLWGGFFEYNDLRDMSPSTFKWTAVVALATQVLYMVILISVGRARYKHRIWAPKTTGHPDFERLFRVQANFVEHFPSFALGLVLCTILVNGQVAGLLGAIWLAFRTAYSVRYALYGITKRVSRYTGPQYLAILLMYVLSVVRVFRKPDN